MLEDKERDKELDHETGLGELSASDDEEVRNYNNEEFLYKIVLKHQRADKILMLIL